MKSENEITARFYEYKDSELFFTDALKPYLQGYIDALAWMLDEE